MGMRDAAGAQPSQSPAVTAPPKGEPRRIPVCTCIGAFLPLPAGEVAARSADGEGFYSLTPPHPPYPPSPRKRDMLLKVRRTFGMWVKTMPLFELAGRPEAVPYIRPPGCIVNCQLSIVNC